MKKMSVRVWEEGEFFFFEKTSVPSETPEPSQDASFSSGKLCLSEVPRVAAARGSVSKERIPVCDELVKKIPSQTAN